MRVFSSERVSPRSANQADRSSFMHSACLWLRSQRAEQAFHGVSERMYQQAAQQQPTPDGGGNGQQPADEEEVVDAEVVDEGNK